MTTRPYRLVLITGPGETTHLIVNLDRAPDAGMPLELPDGSTVQVRDIVSGDEPGIAGTVFATHTP